MSDVVKAAEEQNDFTQLEDGFWYYWVPSRGAVSSHMLRELADELDARNTDWQAVIDNSLSQLPKTVVYKDEGDSEWL